VLGTIDLDDGGQLRYLRYADGVYEQALDAQGNPKLTRQYEPWSTWPTSSAAAALQAASLYNLSEAA
jgi:hypothetical protein